MPSANDHLAADSRSLPLKWAVVFGAGGVSLVALTIAAQIYLSMLSHWHSFVRLAVWHRWVQKPLCHAGAHA